MDFLLENSATKDSTLDLLVIMLDKVMVKFEVASDDYRTELGQYLHVSDLDSKFRRKCCVL